MTASMEKAKETLGSSPEMEELIHQTDAFQNEIDQATNSMRNLKSETLGQQSHMDGLLQKAKQLAVAMGLSKTAKGAMELSDSLTNVNARLNLITGSQAEADALNQKIFASANRSRGSYLETADAVSKLGLQAGDAFRNTDELVAFSEQMNKIFAVSGASKEGAASVMFNLTQAMGAGVLRGQDLNAVLANAPMLMQMMADELGVTRGEIRELAAEGMLSSEVVKNAVLRNMDETNAKFESMPMTFAQMWQKFQNYAIRAFAPVGQRLNELLNSEKFQLFASNVIGALQPIGTTLLWILDMAVSGANLISSNWSIVGPIVYGVAGAFIAVKTAIMLAAAAQSIFNAHLLANPLNWIIMLIASVIAYLYHWVQAVGGVKVAWVMAVDWIINAGDRAVHFFELAGMRLEQSWLTVQFAFEAVWTAIYIFAQDIFVQILLALQQMVNGAIHIINDFIATLNMIPGVNIEAIQDVTFATEAELAAEADKQARFASLDSKLDKIDAIEKDIDRRSRTFEAAMSRRERAQALKYDEMRMQFAAERSLDEINKLLGTNDDGILIDPSALEQQMAGDLGGIKGDTGAMADSMEASEEELVYLRDIAEREAINKYTTAHVSVDFTAHNQISSDMDIDYVFEQFSDKLEEAVSVAAEGDY